MILIDTDNLLKPAINIAGALSEWILLEQLTSTIPNQKMTQDAKVIFLKSLEALAETANKLELKITAKIIAKNYKEIFDLLKIDKSYDRYDLQLFIRNAQTVLSTFQTEITERQLISPLIAHEIFIHKKNSTFDESVEIAFPKIRNEIAEAGKCRAFGLWTASVMHIMRALENPLEILAQYFAIEACSNWNATLNQIEAELKRRNKTNYDSEVEQWASEAIAHLKAIKNAWRNYAQHGKAVYDEMEAISIWNNSHALMLTLAKKINDTHVNQ